MTNRAECQTKFAYLSSDWGRDYACRIFKVTPDELEAKVGRFVRGKRVGQLRGHITWAKTTKGGWVKTGSYDFGAMQGTGFVAPPNLTFAHGLFDGNGQCIAGVDMNAPRFSLAVAMSDAIRAMRPQQEPVAVPYTPDPDDRELTPAELKTELNITGQQVNEFLRGHFRSNRRSSDEGTAAVLRWCNYFPDMGPF